MDAASRRRWCPDPRRHQEGNEGQAAETRRNALHALLQGAGRPVPGFVLLRRPGKFCGEASATAAPPLRVLSLRFHRHCCCRCSSSRRSYRPRLSTERHSGSTRACPRGLQREAPLWESAAPRRDRAAGRRGVARRVHVRPTPATRATPEPARSAPGFERPLSRSSGFLNNAALRTDGLPPYIAERIRVNAKTFGTSDPGGSGRRQTVPQGVRARRGLSPAGSDTQRSPAE